MDLGIKGKTALILSAGGGLGRAIAVAIAREGASVAVTDIDKSSLATTAAEIKKNGANVFSQPVDLADLPGLDDLGGPYRSGIGRGRHLSQYFWRTPTNVSNQCIH